MLLYTALTKARNHDLIEFKEFGAQNGLGRSRGRRTSTDGVGLDDFAFRQLKDLDLLKIVKSIHEGFVEMTPAQHKARGVLLVTQAINLSRAKSSGSAISDSAIKTKFLEAADRLSVHKGNDKELLDQCLKHMEVVLLKRSLRDNVEMKFFDRSKGKYNLGKSICGYSPPRKRPDQPFSLCIGDTFSVDEIPSISWFRTFLMGLLTKCISRRLFPQSGSMNREDYTLSLNWFYSRAYLMELCMIWQFYYLY
jgi:hypothetical protein